jgi:hypothetical protein
VGEKQVYERIEPRSARAFLSSRSVYFFARGPPWVKNRCMRGLNLGLLDVESYDVPCILSRK